MYKAIDQMDIEPQRNLMRHLRSIFNSVPHDANPIPFSAPKSSPICCSITPFSKLNKTSLDELNVDVRSTGTFLLLKSLKVTLNNNVVYLVVEDHKGKSTRCQIFNYVFLNRLEGSEEFSTGTVFVVKEPWLKICLDGNACLFVTTPSDIFIVIRDHSLFEEAVQLGWEDTTDDPNTSAEWKEKGNLFFSSGNYFKAIEAYSMGLKVDHDELYFTLLNLNLAATYLKAGCYELCLEHTSQVLCKEPTNEKALFRAGRANYELGQYKDAEAYFKKLLVEHVSRNALFELERCRNRLKELEGKIDIQKLCESTKYRLAELGTYMGPVHIQSVPGKGRGVIATEDLMPRTLVLVEKAFSRFPILVGFKEKHQKMLSNSAAIAELLRKVYLNPNTIGCKFFDLYSGLKHVTNEIRFCDESDQTEPIVDVTKMWDIVDLNGFEDPSSNPSSLDITLYLSASYINHSCLCNSTSVILGDVITIRTTTMVKKGEEINIVYNNSPELPSTLNIDNRFECTCKFCELERGDPEELRTRRQNLLQRFIILASADPNDVLARSFRRESIKRIVKDLEETYKGREILKTGLFHPYLYLAQCLKLEDPSLTNKTKIMELLDKALNCLGLSMDILIKCTEDPNGYLPPDAFHTKYEITLQVLLLVVSVQTSPEDVNLWLNVLGMFRSLCPIPPSLVRDHTM